MYVCTGLNTASYGVFTRNYTYLGYVYVLMTPHVNSREATHATPPKSHPSHDPGVMECDGTLMVMVFVLLRQVHAPAKEARYCRETEELNRLLRARGQSPQMRFAFS